MLYAVMFALAPMITLSLPPALCQSEISGLFVCQPACSFVSVWLIIAFL